MYMLATVFFSINMSYYTKKESQMCKKART